MQLTIWTQWPLTMVQQQQTLQGRETLYVCIKSTDAKGFQFKIPHRWSVAVDAAGKLGAGRPRTLPILYVP